MPAPDRRVRPRLRRIVKLWTCLLVLTILVALAAGTTTATAHPQNAATRTSSAPVAAAINYALAQLGKPYQWGATGPDSFDCSGLTMRAYQAAGISIPRVSRDQYGAGRHVPLSQLLPGDLVFSTHAEESTVPAGIGHVALYLGHGRLGCRPFSTASAAAASPPSRRAWTPTAPVWPSTAPSARSPAVPCSASRPPTAWPVTASSARAPGAPWSATAACRASRGAADPPLRPTTLTACISPTPLRSSASGPRTASTRAIEPAYQLGNCSPCRSCLPTGVGRPSLEDRTAGCRGPVRRASTRGA